MAVTAAQVSVSTTATALNTATNNGQQLVIKNAGANPIVLGPSGVTTSTGLSLAASATVSVNLAPGEVLYGIVAAATETAHVLRTGV